MSFNPLNYPICFEKPQRLTDVTSWHEHIPFAFTIMQMLKPKTFVELGTHKGDSYCAFCQAVNILGLDTACYAIDTWKGDEHAGFYSPDILEELKAYHDSLYKGFSQLIQSRFEDALDYFLDGSIDLIHIDGCHTYGAIKHDFESWLPKMSKRGVVLFHDINVHENNFGVWKFWGEIKDQYPSFEFKHEYGLGILAVGTNVPEEVLNFLNMKEHEAITTTKLYSYLGDKIVIEHQLQVMDAQINELNDAMQTRDNQINELNDAMQTRDNQINELNDAMQTRDNQINELNEAMQARDARITELADVLQIEDAQISDLEQHAKNREDIISQRNTRINILETGLQENNAQIIELNSALQSIQQSIIWQLLMKYSHFVDRVSPHGTWRRIMYDRCLKGARIFMNEGWMSFWWNFNEYCSSKKHQKQISKSIEEKILENTFESCEEITDDTSKPNFTVGNFLKCKLIYFLSRPDIKLSFPKYEEPIVSIIILTFNKSEFTYQCLDSILAHTDIPYELIIVDNGSTDETISFLDRLENTTIIKNKNNLGFIIGSNQGAHKAKGKYVLFLNNDIVVTPGWLSSLVMTIKNYPKCGAVGCKLVWPNGQLQEAGDIIWNDGSALGYGRGDYPLYPEYSYLKEVDYCSGACLLVQKDLFQMLGGFDERYIPAYYEDTDLCLEIWKFGYKVVFQPNVILYHHEFTSSSFKKAVSYMETNKSKFITKWNDVLKTKLYPSSNNILVNRDLRQGNRILVLDDRIPLPNQGSGYPRAYHMLKFLGELGYKITFFPLDNTTPWQPSTNELQQLGIEVFYGADLNFTEFARNRMNYYELIIVSRPHNMRNNFDTINKYFPNAILIYDAEALFSVREILKAKTKGVVIDKAIANNKFSEEIGLMKGADVVVTVSENEKMIIMDKGGGTNIAVWGHPINIKNFKNDFHERRDILFVGSFLAGEDSPNGDAVLYFAKDIFPNIQKEFPCRLFIVGMNPPESIKKLSSSSIIVTNYVEDIEEYYNKCKIFVVPHRYAAGIPWKLQEAMSYAIPSVVSELIASQLNLKDNNETLIAKNTEEFVQKIVQLYQDEELWYRIQKNAIEYIQRDCNPDTLRNQLNNIIRNTIDMKKIKP